MTQTDQILHALQQGERLTPIDALDRFGCFRLSARVCDIERMGYKVDRQIVQGRRFKVYWMEGHNA